MFALAKGTGDAAVPPVAIPANGPPLAKVTRMEHMEHGP
jgi:hypothetical protein